MDNINNIYKETLLNQNIKIRYYRFFMITIYENKEIFMFYFLDKRLYSFYDDFRHLTICNLNKKNIIPYPFRNYIK